MNPSEQQPATDDVLFERWLRTATGLSQMRIGFVRLFAAYCTPDELAELSAIEVTQILHLGDRMRRLLGLTTDNPALRALCFGSNATHEHLPPRIRACFDPEFPLQPLEATKGLLGSEHERGVRSLPR